jgi:predicted Zn-dependent protease
VATEHMTDARTQPLDIGAPLDALREHLLSLMAGEGFALHLAAEQTSFVRLNRGKVRQPGSVHQLEASLVLYAGQRQASAHLTLAGEPSSDRAALTQAVARLRDVLAHSPDDPLLLRPPEVRSSEEGGPSVEPTAPEEMVEHVLAAADGADFVGILTEGTIARAFADERGQRNVFHGRDFQLDYSVYRHTDKAVKDSLATPVFDRELVERRIARAVERSALLDREPKVLKPGSYRAYIAPAALEQLFWLAAFDAFSRRAVETRRSPLIKLYDGKRAFDGRVDVRCAIDGVAPSFSAEGWVRPMTLPLITEGRAAAPLCSARTAAEFGGESTGVGSDEAPMALEMAGGELAEADVLPQLGTGLYLSNLWYTNWSDKPAARVTGMTRFASMWVEDGQLVAPLSAARFDDSLYRLWGEHLVGFTRDRDVLPDTNTYGRRHPGQITLPGMLVSSLDITL